MDNELERLKIWLLKSMRAIQACSIISAALNYSYVDGIENKFTIM